MLIDDQPLFSVAIKLIANFDDDNETLMSVILCMCTYVAMHTYSATILCSYILCFTPHPHL